MSHVNELLRRAVRYNDLADSADEGTQERLRKAAEASRSLADARDWLDNEWPVLRAE